MSPVLTQIVYFAFPLACILAIPPASRPGSVAERLVAGVALYQFLLLTVGLLLGLTNYLQAPWYAASIGGATLLLAVQGYRNGLHLPGSGVIRYVRTGRGAATLLMVCLAVMAGGSELGFDFLRGTRHGDGLWYHIPRVMFWLRQGNFDAWATPVAASIGLPVGADLVLLNKMLLGLGWNGVGFVTGLLAAGAVACVYLAGLELGMTRWHAAMSALLFASFPAIGLRIWSVNSDIAAAFPALAAGVALLRIRNPRIGLSLFLLLNGMALACKPTVAPPALVLACVTLWWCRQKIAPLWKDALPYAAAVIGACLIVASYWPVYEAFHDFLGGNYSSSHRSANVVEFMQAVAMHSAYWLLEPLGYFTRFKELWEVEALRSVYNALGANFETLPEFWKPYPGQDTGYTGLATVLALPLLFAGAPSKSRKFLIVIFLLGYLPLSGMINPQPYFTRYNVVLLAGIALLWGGAGFFSRGKRRWSLTGSVALNLCALLGIVTINIYLHGVQWSQAGGHYFYVSKEDRETMANALAGRPLLVMTESSEQVSSMDALLTGPRMAFPLSYVICPADGNWIKAFRELAATSNWLAFVHNGRETLIPGPEYARPGHHTCSAVPIRNLEAALADAGWTRYRRHNLVDLWNFNGKDF